jgi:hypothetical protein
LRATVTIKPVTGEITKETVKTTARGKPGVPVNLWSTTVCLLPFAHGAMGAAGTRLSLRPLFSGAKRLAKLGRMLSRERERTLHRHRPTRWLAMTNTVIACSVAQFVFAAMRTNAANSALKRGASS